jgi:hypothetical protein
VALDAATVAVLRARRKAQLTERLEWGPTWTDTGRVLTREDGRALQPSSVTITFQRLAFLTGLPPIRDTTSGTEPHRWPASVART